MAPRDELCPRPTSSRARGSRRTPTDDGRRTLADFDANARRETAEKPGRFLALARAFELDVAAVAFYAVDATGHRLWRASFPGEFSTPRTVEEERFPRAIPDAYRGVDAALGTVMAALEPEDSLVVVSDHGFRADPSPRRVWSLRLLDRPGASSRPDAGRLRDRWRFHGRGSSVPRARVKGSARRAARGEPGSIQTPDGELALAVDVLAVAERPPEAQGTLWQRARAWGLRQLLYYAFGVALDRPAYAYVLARPVDAALSPLWPDGELVAGGRRLPMRALPRRRL